MRTVCGFLLLALSLCAAAEAVQEAASGSDGKATVWVYRHKRFQGGALEPSVYCDEVQLVRMDNGRYFAAQVDPGSHVFRSNDKQSGIEVELKPGQEYYVRVDIVTGMWKGHGALMSVPKEQATYEIRQLKPLGADKIKNRTMVMVDSTGAATPFKPAAAASGSAAAPAVPPAEGGAAPVTPAAGEAAAEGSTAPAAASCPKCGAEVPAGAKFCPKCGNKIE